MKQLRDRGLDAAVAHALAHANGAARTQAITFLVDRPNAVATLDSFLASGSIADQQAVLAALGSIDNPAATDILSRWMDKLRDGKCPLELQLDLLDAAADSKSDAITSKLKKYKSAQKKDDTITEY